MGLKFYPWADTDTRHIGWRRYKSYVENHCILSAIPAIIERKMEEQFNIEFKFILWQILVVWTANRNI